MCDQDIMVRDFIRMKKCQNLLTKKDLFEIQFLSILWQLVINLGTGRQKVQLLID